MLKLTPECYLTLDGSSKGDDMAVVLVLNGDHHIQHVNGLAVERFTEPDPSGFAVDGKVVTGNSVEHLRTLRVDALQGVNDRIDGGVFRDFKIELKSNPYKFS